MLRAIDARVYDPEQLADLEEIEELERGEIAGGSLVIVCRAKGGIYEVERELRRLHGRRLGVIVLRTGPSTYTLRQVDPYLPASLDSVYARLNLIDPAAGGRGSANRWGGSADIGGSPRGSGTRLVPPQVLQACRQSFTAPTLLERLGRVGGAALRTIDIMVAALASVFALGLLGDPVALRSRLAPDLGAQFAVLLAALGGGFYLLRAVRTPGLYGLRAPVGVDWVAVLPLALLGALAGGVWMPADAPPVALGWTALAGLVALPFATEMLFRGLLHGSLVPGFQVEAGGPWRLSWPTGIAALCYALWGVVLQRPAIALTETLPWSASLAVPVLGAVVFGLAAGMARERSASIAPPVLLHWLAVAVALHAYGA
jgi:membrane protease YdiL (CAAX protease family)